MYDFHTHSLLSDGVLLPIELIRRAFARGYKAVAITDHAGASNLEFVVRALVRECEMASRRWDILALPGVELTHIPKEEINTLAKEAKELGARLVVVHGETLVEPVEPGTNRAALTSPFVDILAHPGLLTLEEAHLAARNGIYLELSGRKGHSFSNGHLVRVALKTGAKIVLNSDAHEPEDLLSPTLAKGIAQGAGLSAEEAIHLLERSPIDLLRRLGLTPSA
jgi:histidinol phosphatase-like PHP family hydrolase